MYLAQGAHSFRSPTKQSRSKKGSIHLAIKPLPSEVRGHLPALFSRCRTAAAAQRLLGRFPQLLTFSLVPAREAVQRCCRGVVKHGLWQQQELLPRSSVVVVDNCSKSSGQDAAPHEARALRNMPKGGRPTSLDLCKARKPHGPWLRLSGGPQPHPPLRAQPVGKCGVCAEAALHTALPPLSTKPSCRDLALKAAGQVSVNVNPHRAGVCPTSRTAVVGAMALALGSKTCSPPLLSRRPGRVCPLRGPLAPHRVARSSWPRVRRFSNPRSTRGPARPPLARKSLAPCSAVQEKVGGISGAWLGGLETRGPARVVETSNAATSQWTFNKTVSGGLVPTQRPEPSPALSCTAACTHARNSSSSEPPEAGAMARDRWKASSTSSGPSNGCLRLLRDANLHDSRHVLPYQALSQPCFIRQPKCKS